MVINREKRRICHFNFNAVKLISFDIDMEFEIGEADDNVVGSLDNNEGSVEKDQDMEVFMLIPMDEEAVKDNIQEDVIETPSRERYGAKLRRSTEINYDDISEY